MTQKELEKIWDRHESGLPIGDDKKAYRDGDNIPRIGTADREWERDDQGVWNEVPPLRGNL